MIYLLFRMNFFAYSLINFSLYYEPLDFYTKIDELENSSHGGVVVATGWNVSRVDAPSNTVYVIDPKTNLEFPLEYNKCLIATGLFT